MSHFFNCFLFGDLYINPRFFVIFGGMKEKIILIGKAASGKDFFQKHLVSSGWIPLKQYTTRPKRPSEVGDEYHFVTEKEFDNIAHRLMSVQTFNGWKYGIDIEEALLSDVMIFSPANLFDMYKSLDVKKRKLITNSTIVYLDIDEETRRERLSIRYIGGNEDDSLERRLKADAKDFNVLDNINWEINPMGYVRLCNKNEVDDFLKKLLS